MRLRPYLFALCPLILLLSAIQPGVAHPQDAAEGASDWDRMRGRFDGLWVLATSQSQAQTTVDTAVDQAVNAMNFFMRGVARPLIRSNTPVNREIELRFRESNQIFVRFDDRARYTTTLNRPSREQTFEGDPMRVTQRFRGDTLEQVFQADQGTRWNVYTIQANGQMQVSATTSADMMPQPLRFTLTYRRR